MAREQVLKVAIEDGELVVRIGVDTLAFAANQGPLQADFYVHNADQFAADVAVALEQESCYGEGTYIMSLLDEAMNLAVENGTPAAMEVEVDIEDDGRYLAEVPDVPGVMAYGDSPVEAAQKAVEIAQAALKAAE